MWIKTSSKHSFIRFLIAQADRHAISNPKIQFIFVNIYNILNKSNFNFSPSIQLVMSIAIIFVAAVSMIILKDIKILWISKSSTLSYIRLCIAYTGTALFSTAAVSIVFLKVIKMA
jgi:hypothetical protein